MTQTLGLDVGGTSIKWARLSSSGAQPVLTASGTIPTPRTGSADVLDALALLVCSAFDDSAHDDSAHDDSAHDDSAHDTAAGGTVGVGVPATVDYDGGRLRCLPNVPGEWTDRPLGTELSARCGRTVTVVNDAHAFAWGQLQVGAARGAADALFVTLGTGVGGAVVSGGRLCTGRQGLGGAIGHVPVEPVTGARCGCGSRGCLETVAGGRALAYAGAALVRDGWSSALAAAAGGQPGRVTAADVLRAADTDLSCAALVERAGRALGIVVAGLATVLAPEVVVFGGGVAAGFARLRPWLDRALADYAPLPPKPRLVRADYGGLAGAVGAAVWAVRPPPRTSEPQAPERARTSAPDPDSACTRSDARTEEMR